MAAPGVTPVTARPVLREVADGVHAYEQLPGGWCLNNAGLIADGGDAVLVDTVATRARAAHLRAEVLRVAPAGPRYVVNTHFHGDHVFGNADFAPAAVVAHHRTGSDMVEAGLGLTRLWPDVEWGDIRLTPPDVTFTDRLTLPAGRLTAELIHVGPAHTASDVVVWVPQRRVLFTGDVAWSGVTPYVLMGSVDGSLRALELMRQLRPVVVVAGHGRVGGSEVLDFTEAYLRWVQDLARTGLREGRSVRETAEAAGPGPFGALPEGERLISNLHRAYAELQGLPPGGRIDVAASFREMVAFHGAPPQCAA